MGDPFLNYFALGLLVFVIVVLFYGIIAIHDIPYLIAKSRNHPHQDAIHAAGWVSLFMLHVSSPFLWIWAMAYRPEREWGFGKAGMDDAGLSSLTAEVSQLRQRVAQLKGATNSGASIGAIKPTGILAGRSCERPPRALRRSLRSGVSCSACEAGKMTSSWKVIGSVELPLRHQSRLDRYPIRIVPPSVARHGCSAPRARA